MTDGPRCESTDTNSGEPCQRQVSNPSDTCRLHPDDGELPDGHGAPKGNRNAVGNDGGSPSKGNENAVKHGLYQSVKRRVHSLDSEQQRTYMAHVQNYQEQGVDTMQAVSLASAELLKEEVEVDLFDDLFKTIYTDAGNQIDVPKSDMMDAWQGFKREIRMTRHHEGLSTLSGGDSDGHANADLLVNPDADD